MANLVLEKNYILVLYINHSMKKNKICIEPQNLKKLFFQLQISVCCIFIRENDAKNEKCGKIFNGVFKNNILKRTVYTCSTVWPLDNLYHYLCFIRCFELFWKNVVNYPWFWIPECQLIWRKIELLHVKIKSDSLFFFVQCCP